MSDDIDGAHSHQSIQHNGKTYIKLADAAVTFRHLRAEITRLRAELATARRDGMEEAAQIAEDEPEPEGEPPPELHGRSVKNIAIASIRATKRSIAAAIRAAAGEVKP